MELLEDLSLSLVAWESFLKHLDSGGDVPCVKESLFFHQEKPRTCSLNSSNMDSPCRMPALSAGKDDARLNFILPSSHVPVGSP